MCNDIIGRESCSAKRGIPCASMERGVASITTSRSGEVCLMANYLGHQFGNYRLTRLLGQGGFAEVYLAEHIWLEKHNAAIKVLSTSLPFEDGQRFLTEAQTLAQLDHPSIIHLKEFAVQSNVPFLVMDYAPEGNLRDYHPQGAVLSVETVVS